MAPPTSAAVVSPVSSVFFFFLLSVFSIIFPRDSEKEFKNALKLSQNSSKTEKIHSGVVGVLVESHNSHWNNIRFDLYVCVWNSYDGSDIWKADGKTEAATVLAGGRKVNKRNIFVQKKKKTTRKILLHYCPHRKISLHTYTHIHGYYGHFYFSQESKQKHRFENPGVYTYIVCKPTNLHCCTWTFSKLFWREKVKLVIVKKVSLEIEEVLCVHRLQ